MPVTGTLTVVVFAAMVTVAGTEATEGLDELRLITCPPAGAADDSTRLRFLLTKPGTDNVAGENEIFGAT